MKIKISRNGNLEIERAGEWKEQYCPHCPRIPEERLCGDYCPLFGEPKYRTGLGEQTTLEICDGKVLVGYIQDERGK